MDDTLTLDIGTVVGGKLLQGILHEFSAQGQPLVIGPDKRGKYHPVRVRSIHRQRAAVDCVHAGELATLALVGIDRKNVRAGMVILPQPASPDLLGSKSFYEFDAFVSVLSCTKHSIFANAKGLLHVGCVKQLAIVKNIVPSADQSAESGAFSSARPLSLQRKGSKASLVMSMPFLAKGEKGVVRFRFTICPEYLKPGARLYFRDGNNKMMGHVINPVIA
jgi:GTPase